MKNQKTVKIVLNIVSLMICISILIFAVVGLKIYFWSAIFGVIGLLILNFFIKEDSKDNARKKEK